MKKIFIYSMLALALILPVGAQTSLPGQAFRDPRQNIREEMKNKREEIKSSIPDMREDFHVNVQQKRDELRGLPTWSPQDMREEIKTRRDELKFDIKEKREEFRANVQERRAELKDLILEKKEILKEQLQKVKDERKKQIVERVDARLDELNGRMLNHFSSVLDKLEDILERITSRADRVEKRGLDVSTVRVVISEALRVIESSRVTIQEQMSKIYTITVTSENNLRVDVGKARKTFHDDFTKVRETIKAAHDAVRRAAAALTQISKVGEVNNVPSTSDEMPASQ